MQAITSCRRCSWTGSALKSSKARILARARRSASRTSKAPAKPVQAAAQAAETEQATDAYDSLSSYDELDVNDFILGTGIVDYYRLLNVEDTATAAEIKAAYRSLAKVCHVDIAGDDAHDTCILLNEAYTVLSDPEKRLQYNKDLDEALQMEDDGYTGELLSKWMANKKMGKNKDLDERRGVFVDEVTCIGCRECIYAAAGTFRIEEQFGRSRVFAHWINTEEEIQTAMDCCPVSCIHWVDKDDLPALEYVIRNKVPRPNVAAMMSGQAGYIPDVWDATAKYLKERKAAEEQRARAAAARARYSRAQDMARRQAAQGLLRRQMGWFVNVAEKVGLSGMAENVMSSMDEAVGGGSYLSSSDDEYAYYRKVGRRRRSRRAVDGSFGARGMNGGKVPLERALVPVAATRQVWHRR